MGVAEVVDHNVQCGEEGVPIEHKSSVPFPWGSGSKPTLVCGHLPLKLRGITHTKRLSMSLEDYYNELEARLGSILLTLGSQLSPEESREVNHFLDVGEYGLALQTLTDLLIEERKKISIGTYNDVVGVAKRMGIKQEIALEDLERRRVHEDV